MQDLSNQNIIFERKVDLVSFVKNFDISISTDRQGGAPYLESDSISLISNDNQFQICKDCRKCKYYQKVSHPCCNKEIKIYFSRTKKLKKILK